MTTTTAYNEEELLVNLSHGDEQAFVAVVEHYRKNIYTTALRLTHTSVLAEEVLQDVFLKVWLNKSILPSLESFPAWLNRVSRNTMYTAFKKSLKESALSTDETEWSLVSPDDVERRLLDKEFDAILREAINHLPPKQKLTYQLIREEGLKRDQAAAQLGVSPETVKFNLEEAMRKIRTYCLSRLPLAALVLMHMK